VIGKNLYFFIVYYDDSKLRGYISELGNLWNTTTKQAYGNDDIDDQTNRSKRRDFPVKDYDEALIIKDITTRIVEKI